jgi:hypothetical protein
MGRRRTGIFYIYIITLRTSKHSGSGDKVVQISSPRLCQTSQGGTDHFDKWRYTLQKEFDCRGPVGVGSSILKMNRIEECGEGFDIGPFSRAKGVTFVVHDDIVFE